MSHCGMSARWGLITENLDGQSFATPHVPTLDRMDASSSMFGAMDVLWLWEKGEDRGPVPFKGKFS